MKDTGILLSLVKHVLNGSTRSIRSYLSLGKASVTYTPHLQQRMLLVNKAHLREIACVPCA